MGQRAVPPPSPAVLETATAHHLGDHVRGYTAGVHSTTKPLTKRKEVLLTVLAGLGTLLPVTLMVLVAWWLGLALLVVAALALVVWLRRPVPHVHEFRAGLVTVAKDGVDALRWDQVASVYQDVEQFFVNGVYGSTNHRYRLVTDSGRHVTLGGSVNEQHPAKSHTDIDELAAALLREIPARHLRTAVDTLNQGGEVRFDKITLSRAAITTPAATTPWSEVRDLVASAGHIALYTDAPKPWQLKIAEIPNYPLFWTLAQDLRKPR